MPLPKTKDIGALMHFLKKDKPGMPQKQKVAIALNTARHAGASIPKPSEETHEPAGPEEHEAKRKALKHIASSYK